MINFILDSDEDDDAGNDDNDDDDVTSAFGVVDEYCAVVSVPTVVVFNCCAVDTSCFAVAISFLTEFFSISVECKWSGIVDFLVLVVLGVT